MDIGHFSPDIGTSDEIPCKDKSGDGVEGVGLGQWDTTSHDAKSRIYSTHTVCRYGELYNVAPQCPWNACLNGDCSKCANDWQANKILQINNSENVVN